MTKNTKPQTKSTRSEGAIALKRTGLSAPQIARRLGLKSDRGVSHWTSGRRLPLQQARLVLEREFGIAPADWDRVADVPAPPKRQRLRAGASTTAQARAEKLGQMVDAVLSDPALRKRPPMERVELLAQAARTLTVLSKLSGEAHELPVSAIVSTPHWRRVERATAEALEPWPDALEALRAAITKLATTGEAPPEPKRSPPKARARAPRRGSRGRDPMGVS